MALRNHWPCVATFIHKKMPPATTASPSPATIDFLGDRRNKKTSTARTVATDSCLVYPAASKASIARKMLRRPCLGSSYFEMAITASSSNSTIVRCWRNSGPT